MSPRWKKALGIAAVLLGAGGMAISFLTAVADRTWIQAAFPNSWRAFMPMGVVGCLWLTIGIVMLAAPPAPPDAKK